MTGTRAELVAELRRLAVGWDHLGKPALATAANEGADELACGEWSSIQVGYTEYVVTGE